MPGLAPLISILTQRSNKQAKVVMLIMERRTDKPTAGNRSGELTRLPGDLTVGDSGLCCYVPCLLSTITSLCLLILHRPSRPRSVLDYADGS